MRDETLPPPTTDSDDIPERHRIGDLLRNLRVEQGLSIRTLAGFARCSPSLISQVELNHTSPSISTLDRIASVFGLSLSDFFRLAEPSQPIVIRADERVRAPEHSSRGMLERLTQPGDLEVMMMTLTPAGERGCRIAAGAGEFFGIIFSGSLVLRTEDMALLLGVGDAVSFPQDTPHVWNNEGHIPAQVVVIFRRPRAAFP